MIESNKVSDIFFDCLFKEAELADGKPIGAFIKVEGITQFFGFNPERIKKHEQEIENFIDELPDQFKEGYSFLKICETKDSYQWTGSQMVCEQLVSLGIASQKMAYSFPREMWRMLPGSVPYIEIVKSHI